MRLASLLLLLIAGCRAAAASPVPAPPPAPPPVAATAEGAAVVTTAEIELAPLPPAKVEQIDVPRDVPASYVRARGDTARIVFLPGLCSNAYAYLRTFPEAARAHGGVVAIDGDQPCGAPDSGYRMFTWSAPLQRARIEAALAALALKAPPDGLTLVGYSAGASIVQMIHARWPAEFPRLVIIAPPEEVYVDKLTKARGVVSMSCRMDVPYLMKAATKQLLARNVPSIYLEMPGCTHGGVTEGERVFGEAFDWLDARG